MLQSILATRESFGPVTAIRSPVGRLAELLAELADHPDLAAVATEGDDELLKVDAGDHTWPYGGV